MSHFENPCLACTLERICCQQLDGLKLTKSEFDRHFADHADKFDIVNHGRWLRIDAKKATTCPHWEGQCTIYESRPIECGLYPHTIGEIIEHGDDVKLTYHARTACPLKNSLLAPQKDSEEAIKRFAKDAFGPNTNVTIRAETGVELLSVLPRKLARKISAR